MSKIFSARSLVPVLCGHLFFGLMLTGASRAQTPKAPAITSPQVLPDRQVAFRVYAPNAREQRYHVHRRPDGRAIAGLSLGGELALTVGLRHPETFQWIASFSGSLFEKDFADRFGAFLDRPDAISKAPQFIWIGCGSGDLFLPGSKKLSELLTAKGIRHTLRETEGYHTWLVWRPYLAEVLPLLFRRQT